ncbi:MAG: CAP domain-containing protein [Deltaproteobacteria bacterium]|nr:CAP domain-containing protein [Deltaproteobacteria bacterium]
MSFVRVGLRLALLLAVACVHAPPVTRPGQPAASRPQVQPAVAPNNATIPSPTPWSRPSAPAATTYGGPPLPPFDDGPLTAQVRKAIRREVASAGFAAPVSDGRLDRAAADLARVPAGSITNELVGFFVHHYGVAEPQPGLLVVHTDAGDADAADLAMTQLRPRLTKVAWPRLGVGSYRANGTVNIIVLMGLSAIDLQPLPRVLQGSASASFAGSLPAGYGNAEFVLTTPSGATVHLPLQVQGRGFRGAFSCVAGPGAYDVELLAEASRGPEVMVNVPVFCDVAPPARFDGSATDLFAGATTPLAVENTMLAVINDLRAKRHLPALILDVRLRDVARRHSDEMARLERVAHTSPDGRTPVDRIRAAKLSPTSLGENVGGATSPAAVHDGFMASPGHRSNVFDALATHAGIGVVATTSSDGAVVWYVTELFARFSPLPPAAQKRNR